jgi:formylglycine-generating enzyme required for sulfatase activity
MKKTRLILSWLLMLAIFPSLSNGKELPKIAVWYVRDLVPRNPPASHTEELTFFAASEISKLKKYEVYSQENIRTLAGWSPERMKQGCTDTKCLLALAQMGIAKLISGSVGKIGKRYIVSLRLFDTQKASVENTISKTCEAEAELIKLIRASALELLGEYPSTQAPAKAEPPALVAKTAQGDYRDSVTGMEFILVKGGCFAMGDIFGDGDSDEKPLHEVCLKNFYLGTYEVTQGQWKRVMGSNPSHFEDGDEYPVEKVAWNDVQEFIRRLNQISGKSYRLPTEAEWEYAARSGGKTEKWAGTSDEAELRGYAWFSANSGKRSHPVGQKRANGLGLYDMSGNVCEWTNDGYDILYYKNSPKNDPLGPGIEFSKVLRGGSWYDNPYFVRVADRSGLAPTVRSDSIGFRLGFPTQ